MSEQEVERCHEMGFSDEDINKVLTLEDLVSGDEIFFAATGVTSGDFLRGVVYTGDNMATTHSVVMRSKSGTIRFVEATHKLDKNEILRKLMKAYGNR